MARIPDDKKHGRGKVAQMRKPGFIDPHNPVRSWARRIARSSAARPDVLVGQLARRLDVLERLVVLPEDAEASIAEAVSLLRPTQFQNLLLERIGSANDGGYVLPRLTAEDCDGVVSIGVGSNNDCDVALAERGLLVHAWDHTVAQLPRPHARIAFHRVGLGAGADLMPLADIVDASFGPTATRLALLLDAEGAEWEALGTASPTLLGRFDVISLEMHDLGDVLAEPARVLGVLRVLHESFAPVAVHVNNHGAMWRVGPWDWPDALEVTYVRRGLVSGPGSAANCPPDLLAPCCIDLPDPRVSWLAG